MESARTNSSDENEKVISPFSESEARISQKPKKSGKLLLIIGCGLLLVLAGGIATLAVTRFLNDPYRTLESFPVSKYFDNYQALAGSKFKANFRVEADLGWKEGAGRLMLFSTTDDSRPIAVLIPSAVSSGIYFTKGQTYIAEVEVKEGGLIYANSFQKN